MEEITDIFSKPFKHREEADALLYYKEGKITKRVYEAILNYPIDEVMKLKRTAALELIKKGE